MRASRPQHPANDPLPGLVDSHPRQSHISALTGSLTECTAGNSRLQMIRLRFRFVVVCWAAALAALSLLPTAPAQAAGAMQISWEVRNRFRLFKEERDFLLHVEAMRGRSIL